MPQKTKTMVIAEKVKGQQQRGAKVDTVEFTNLKSDGEFILPAGKMYEKIQ